MLELQLSIIALSIQVLYSLAYLNRFLVSFS